MTTTFSPEMADRLRELMTLFKLPTLSAEVTRRFNEAQLAFIRRVTRGRAADAARDGGSRA